jgi:hypothetical protein
MVAGAVVARGRSDHDDEGNESDDRSRNDDRATPAPEGALVTNRETRS